jgi:hypothetical protein
VSGQPPSEVNSSEAVPLKAEVESTAASRSASPQETTRFTELERIPPDSQNPDLKVRKQLDGKKDKFMADLRKPKANAMQVPSMGPREGPPPPGLGHDIAHALQKLEAGRPPLTQTLEGSSPQAIGGLFAQASPEKLASCLNEMGSASEAQRRDLIPKFFDAMAKAQPPVKLSGEVLSRLDESALRGLATHVKDNSPGAGAMLSSGLLGELVQRAEGNPKNAMAAMEGLSRLNAATLPGAMSQLGLTPDTLKGWIQKASASDPMSPKGGWANPETVQRLAGKLAEQPGGAGIGTAKALLSEALASQTKKGLTPDTGLQQSLQSLSQREQAQAAGLSPKATQASGAVHEAIGKGDLGNVSSSLRSLDNKDFNAAMGQLSDAELSQMMDSARTLGAKEKEDFYRLLAAKGDGKSLERHNSQVSRLDDGNPERVCPTSDAVSFAKAIARHAPEVSKAQFVEEASKHLDDAPPGDGPSRYRNLSAGAALAQVLGSMKPGTLQAMAQSGKLSPGQMEKIAQQAVVPYSPGEGREVAFDTQALRSLTEKVTQTNDPKLAAGFFKGAADGLGQFGSMAQYVDRFDHSMVSKETEGLIAKAAGQGSAECRAASAKAMIESELFQDPSRLTDKARLDFTQLVGSAPEQLLNAYVESGRYGGGDRALDMQERGQLAQMVQTLGFDGPKSTRDEFNQMWGNFIGSTVHRAMTTQPPDENLATRAGELFSAFTEGAEAAKVQFDAYRKDMEKLLGAVTSGLLGGFSWKLSKQFNEFNLMSPVKEGSKSVMERLTSRFTGENPHARELSKETYDALTGQAGAQANQIGLTEEEWGRIYRAFGEGADIKVR